MGIPWGEAIRVGVVGFGMVFMLLIIVGVVIWLTGIVFGRSGTGETEATANKKGE